MHHDNRSFLLAILALAAAAVVCVSAASSAGPVVTEQAFAFASRPQSPGALILESRQIAPAQPGRGLGTAGWLALGLVVVGSLVALSHFGGQALRQWRLTWGKGGHRSPHPMPMLPQTEFPLLPTVRPVQAPPQLPAGGYHEN